MHNTLDCCHTFTYSLTHSFTHYFSRFFLLLLCLLFVFDDENISQLETNVLRLFVNTLEILLALFLCVLFFLYGQQKCMDRKTCTSFQLKHHHQFSLSYSTHTHTLHTLALLFLSISTYFNHTSFIRSTHIHTHASSTPSSFSHMLSHSPIQSFTISASTFAQLFLVLVKFIVCLSVCPV